MAHHEPQENLSPEEQKYQDLVSRGDDYHRIELYRWALHYYNLAKEMHIHDDTLEGKIEVVSNKIRKETRAILAVLGVAVVIIVFIWLISR
ncbi:MAG: hypothetical protein AB9842_08485 [Bacteroidales bacterium]